MPVKVMRAAEAGATRRRARARRRGVVLDLPGGGRGVARVVARLRALGDRRGARARVKPVGCCCCGAGPVSGRCARARRRAPSGPSSPIARRPPGLANEAGAAARVRADAGKLRAPALGLAQCDPLALSCEKASGALRVVATLRDALGLVVVALARRPATTTPTTPAAATNGDDGRVSPAGRKPEGRRLRPPRWPRRRPCSPSEPRARRRAVS